MAYNHPGSSPFSFQQQVAHPSSRETARNNARSLSSRSYPNSSSSSSSSFSPSSSRYSHFPACGTNVNTSPSQPFGDAQFDVFEWYVQYQSCVRYFLDYGQYSAPVQAVTAFANIQLPFQKSVHPVLSSNLVGGPPGAGGVMGEHGTGPTRSAAQPIAYATLVPYIRRLVATGLDTPAVLHGFFGDDWGEGIGRIHETERRNYLFAAKSDNWLKVKTDYDMSEDQTIPFLRPLLNVSEEEIVSAETTWSEWLAMQDWMLGPRAPAGVGGRANIKREQD
ncbi:hypothetical protein CMQ_6428 [Grosmannia clavigera kw1407]|uniref:Ilp is an apoptosis inhibitor n=1 Tax=Grosmannia clavigera (strain kw1407 / UAMH 11150) TaxID=655863 RepID=F0XLY4_GROCL|nr:uncharacterized protein CMQ_6428 [Grosmannia clavigera kw1407]EFX01486.1 hypothetical protein CMQ_6428 [Grosmannia clavigera kw1407]